MDPLNRRSPTFSIDGRLQYPVRVETPNPVFARALQQAIGGVEGEIRVALQYTFQAFGARGPTKYRDMLMNTAAEELGPCSPPSSPTMHQNQWMAAIDELEGSEGAFPIPNSFPQELENQDYNYVFLGFNHDGSKPPSGRSSEGQSIDGKGTFSSRRMEPEGEDRRYPDHTP